MTLAEKILAAHSGKHRVEPGEFVHVRLDLVMANDVTAELVIKGFRELGLPQVFDPARVVMVADHLVPAKDIRSAEQAKVMHDFAWEQDILYYEVGKGGIEHVLLPEQGLVLPGQVVVGGDSHTCTYGALGAFSTGMGSTDIAVAMARGEIWMKVPPTIRFLYHGHLPKWVGGKDLILHTIGDIGVDGALYCAMQFEGEAIGQLNMDGRFTMANMAIEAGAKAGLCLVDDKIRQYVAQHSNKSYTAYKPDPDASYASVHEYDVSQLEPQVALPSLPSNVRPISQVGNVPLDQVAIGMCTNGRLEDLQVAASILKGRQVHPGLRCIVIAGSQTVYLDAMKEGLLKAFAEAGAAVSTPTCGPCMGAHMGVLAAGERCLATTNRNFVGRMGSPKSEVYLAGPAVAAASAIAGRIASPEEVA